MRDTTTAATTAATTMEKQETVEGDQYATIIRDGSRCAHFRSGEAELSVPIWTGGIYEARRRKRDGILTWRRVATWGDTCSGRSPSRAFVDRMSSRAPCWFLPPGTIKHGDICD